MRKALAKMLQDPVAREPRTKKSADQVLLQKHVFPWVVNQKLLMAHDRNESFLDLRMPSFHCSDEPTMAVARCTK